MRKYRLIHQNSNIEAPEGRFDVGRSIECALVLDDPSVSRVHATIVGEGDKLYLEDRGSRNGCLINGTRISGKVRLNDGDRISIGHQTIRVVALERMAAADRTMALAACQSCGAWIAQNDNNCSSCGKPRTSATDARETFQNDEAMGRMTPSMLKAPKPGVMIAGLLQKAINMEKYEEAERLLGNLMESLLKRSQSSQDVEDNDLVEIGALTAALAEASGSPKHISALFAFHHAHGSLIPRETVEMLYELVRKVSYRACAEMSRYLSFLSRRADRFSPGQKFVHRRLEGLVSICS